MNKEQSYLIEISNEYLLNKKTTLNNLINEKEFIILAKQHGLLGVVYCVAKNAQNVEIVDPELLKNLRQNFLKNTQAAMLQSNVKNEALVALGSAGIRHVCFKGSVIKAFYPVPEVRTMGDVDILIDPENESKAKGAMLKAGFKITAENGPVWNYEKDGVLIEMHTCLLHEELDKESTIKYFNTAMEHATFNGFQGEFDPLFHFEYLIAHMAHHFYFHGAGIRFIIDLAVMGRHFNINFKKAVLDLETAGLGTFAKQMISVCEQWFSVGEKFVNNTENVETFIASHGVFGMDERNDAAVIARKNLEKGDKKALKLKTIFPPYEHLRQMPYIKFLNGRPFLTPVAWVYRIFYYIFNKNTKGAIKATMNLGTSATITEAEAELQFFKEIGL